MRLLTRLVRDLMLTAAPSHGEHSMADRIFFSPAVMLDWYCFNCKPFLFLMVTKDIAFEDNLCC